MDRLIYTAMTGANATLARQASVTHNLANAASPGYKSVSNAFKAVPVGGGADNPRALVAEVTTGIDPAQGAIRGTGRPLDLALQGNGWFVVRGMDGKEAYTRNGSFAIGNDGTLQTRSGLPVIGDSGPIAIPADSEVSIGRDGTVSVVTPGTAGGAPAVVARLKTVASGVSELVRGDDGLFRSVSGAPAPEPESVFMVSGALEESNVNVVDQMVQMIGVSRQFELQTRMIQMAEANDKAAQQVLARTI